MRRRIRAEANGPAGGTRSWGRGLFNSIEKRSQSEFTSRGLGAIVLAQCADGFRVIARKDGAHVRLYSRPGNDLTSRFPLIVEAVGTTALALRCGQSILR